MIRHVVIEPPVVDQVKTAEPWIGLFDKERASRAGTAKQC